MKMACRSCSSSKMSCSRSSSQSRPRDGERLWSPCPAGLPTCRKPRTARKPIWECDHDDCDKMRRARLQAVTGRSPKWLEAWARFRQATVSDDALPRDVVARSNKLLFSIASGAIAAGAREPEMQRPAETAPLKTAPVIGAGRARRRSRGFPERNSRHHAGNRRRQSVRARPSRDPCCAGRPGGGREELGSRGSDVLLAIALGYEIGSRIGIASKLRVTMHPHGTWGTVGAAVAVAKLRHATRGQMAEVINVSSTLGLATSRRTMLEGGTVRNSFAGFSNKSA